MKAIAVYEDSSLKVVELNKPEITEPDQIIVKVAYAGLCGSDIDRIFNKGAHFYPITLGHEFSGTIVAVGSEVKNLQVGDNIASVPLSPCFKCDECQHGYFSLCKKYSFVGSREQGGFADYVVMKYTNAFKLPNTVSLLAGAFFEPLTVSMHGIYLAGGCENKNVIIIGAGTIGLLALQAVKGMNPASITIIDINQVKLDLALELGADKVFNPMQISNKEIAEQLYEYRFDQLILETAGNPKTVLSSIEIAGPRAIISLIGTLHQDLNMPNNIFSAILRKELTIKGSWMNYSAIWPGKEWQTISNLFSDNKITLDHLIANQGNYDSFITAVTNLKGSPMNGKILLNNT